MKSNRLLLALAILVIVVIIGCEYDVKQPLWYSEYTEPPTPVITQIEPPQVAHPGVNLITIRGENFTPPPAGSDVYFDITPAEIVQASETLIKVRRPNLVTDSCGVKVVAKKALVVARYGPYKIEPVMERYGTFVENLILSVLLVDPAENLFVIEAASRNVVKVSPGGDKTVVGTTTRAPTDARMGPDGNIYLMGNSRIVDMVDLAADTVKRWTQLPSGKNVKFGDFDAKGYFYTGGTRTDLLVVPFDLSTTTAIGSYATEEILAIRVYGGYVYVASKTSTQPPKIWRHTIGAGGSLSSRELVFDMSTSSDFSARIIKAIALAADGAIFIATDSPNPILIVDSVSGNVDFFYKNILPPYCKHFDWGNGNYLYMISGNTSPAQEWTVYRVDMGIKKAR